MKTTAEAGKPLVLFSIRPKYCLMYTDGTKRVEIRKTRPKIETPFTGLIYCTESGKDIFYRSIYSYDDVLYTAKHKASAKNRLTQNGHTVYNGKVIGEFVCDRIDEVYQCNSGWVQENAHLSRDEFFDYLGIPRDTHLGYDKKAYAFHVSDLTIYDKPKDLREFRSYNVKARLDENGYPVPTHEMTRPPQSWCYVEKL